MAYSPLAQGFLSCRYDKDNPPKGGVRRANPLFLPENLERARGLFAALKQCMECLGGPQDYVVRVMHERVFRFMHRI